MNTLALTIKCTKMRQVTALMKKYGAFLNDCGYNPETHIRTFTGQFSASAYNRLVSFCDRHEIKVKIANDFTTRSLDYRQQFFSANPPTAFGKYRCVYCGRKFPKPFIQVDHLYPVDGVQTDLKLMKRLKRRGYGDINDVRNLVPACERCNKAKSNKMGFWIIKGRLGRHKTYWILRKILTASLVVGSLFFIIYAYFDMTPSEVLVNLLEYLKSFL